MSTKLSILYIESIFSHKKEAVAVARQAKDRKVCILPKNVQFRTENFFPVGFSEAEKEGTEKVDLDPQIGQLVTMSVEEYETVRLIDYMGFTQEECARHMQVARTTVQRIYNDARKKLSIFLVEGNQLQISGGSYALCTKGGNCKCQTVPCKEGFCQKVD